jgi:threonine synthase
MSRVAATEGICICPETAVCFDCLERLIENRLVQPHEEIVIFNTGAAQKYPDILPFNLPQIEKDAPFPS